MQVIQGRPRRVSVAEQLMHGGLSGAGDFLNQQNQQRDQQQQAQSGAENEFQKMAYQAELQRQQQQERFAHENQLQGNKFAQDAFEKMNKSEEEKKGKLAPLEGALNSVRAMRNIRKRKNLGPGTDLFSYLGGDTARDKGEYSTLGNSLIQYATTIPIRNRTEFEQIAGHIADPSITDAEAEGILKRLEEIIEDSASVYRNEEDQGLPSRPQKNSPGSNKSSDRKSLSNFDR